MKSRIFPLLFLLGTFFGLVFIIFTIANYFQKQSPSQNFSSVLTQIKNTISNTPTSNQTSNAQNSKYNYQNQNKNFNTYFPDDFIDTNSNIKFEKKDSYITFYPINTRHTKSQNIDGQIIYPKIYQNNDKFIDLKYIVNTNQLVEEYIVNQPQTIPLLQQKVSIFNAYPVIKNNQIDFYKPVTNNFLWSIPTPFMYEQNHPETKNYGIKFELKCENPKTPLKDCRSFIFTKKITPEGQAWLDDPNRDYPIVIDPFVDGGPCWGIGGYCDSGCSNTAVTAATVYTGCTIGGNCWSASGEDTCHTSGCKDTYCTGGSYSNDHTSTCTTSVYTRYSCGGTCSTDGSGSCRYPYDGATRYTVGGCSSVYRYDHYWSCHWVAATYTRTGAVTKYTGNAVACSGTGSGSCYKLTSGASYYNGTNCNTGTFYNSTTCSWYPGIGGTNMKFEALKIEGIKVN